jgi:glycosyltransferase involved in cell wall biosynthesis
MGAGAQKTAEHRQDEAHGNRRLWHCQFFHQANKILAPMKVLYLTDQVSLAGGAERILIQKLNYWAQHPGDEAVLITTAQRGNPPFAAIDRRVVQEDLAINYTEGKSYYHPENLKRIRRHFTRLRAAVRKHRPDAVVVVSRGVSRFIAPFAAKGFPTYNEYHTSYTGVALQFRRLSRLSKIKKRVTRRLIRWVESHYTKIVFLNQAERDHYQLRNAAVIPNFFEEFPPIADFRREKKAVALGRLSHEKGFDLLIDAWKRVAAEAPEWQLEIYGSGAEGEALENQIETAWLPDRVRLMGQTGDIQQVLSQASFYVMSSRTETFPMALLEAMSAGLPVVTFDCPTGPRAILAEGEDSLFVPAGDVAALADKILFLMRHPETMAGMGQNALRNVGRFSRDKVMAQWRTLFTAGWE